MAKSITIHDLDDSVAKLIEAKAKSDGRSLNKTIPINDVWIKLKREVVIHPEGDIIIE